MRLEGRVKINQGKGSGKEGSTPAKGAACVKASKSMVLKKSGEEGS